MDLVDKEYRILGLLQFLDDLLDAFLEITAIAGARQECAHVEGIDSRIGQHVGNFILDDLAGYTFRDGGLAHAGVADEKRIILAAPSQHLDTALDFGITADQRVDLAGFRLLIEIDAIGGQRIAILALFLGFLDAAHDFLLGGTGLAADTVRNEIHRVVARHIALGEKIGGVAFTLGEQRDQDIRPGDFLSPGVLDMDHGALDDALEASRRLGIFLVINDQFGELIIDVFHQGGAQLVEIDVASLHHRIGIAIIHEREQ